MPGVNPTSGLPAHRDPVRGVARAACRGIASRLGACIGLRRRVASARVDPGRWGSARHANLSPPPRGRRRPHRGHRPVPGIPRPAGRCLLAPVQHRVPGGVPGRHQLPRLPQPRRRGPLRGGVHPLPRPEPGRGDVCLRLLRPLRARLPPRGHRPAPRDPGHEAVPRGVARGLGHPRCHPADHAPGREGRRDRVGPGRAGRGSRAGRQGLPGDGLRQSPLRRRNDARRRPGVPLAARGDRDGRTPCRAPRRDLPLQHHDREGCPLRGPAARLRGYRHLRRRHGRRGPRHRRLGPRRRPVRRRLHEEGEPRPAARGWPQRRRRRWWLHGDGLLPDQPPPRRRERDDRLPADPLRARRRRGGAGRDGARGRPDGVPRQPDRARGRGREAHRRAVHPQQARRA